MVYISNGEGPGARGSRGVRLQRRGAGPGLGTDRGHRGCAARSAAHSAAAAGTAGQGLAAAGVASPRAALRPVAEPGLLLKRVWGL